MLGRLRSGARAGEPDDTADSTIASWASWLGPQTVVGLALTAVAALQVVAIADAALEYPLSTARSAAVTYGALTAVYALAARLFRRVAFEYVAALLLPAAALLALEGGELVDREWYGAALAALAVGYVAVRWLRGGARAGEPAGATPLAWASWLGPETVVALALTATAAALAPLTTFAPAAATLWLLTAAYAVATALYRRPLFELVAALLLPVAVLLTIEAREVVDPLWYGVALAGMAGPHVAVGWLRGERPVSGASPQELLRSACAETLVGFGLVAVAAAYPPIMLSVDEAVDRGTLVDSAAVSYALLAAVTGGAAALHRSRALEYVAAVLLGVAYLLALESTSIVEPAWRGVAVAGLAAAYALVGWTRRVREPREPSSDPAAWLDSLGPETVVALGLTAVAACIPVVTAGSGDDALLTLCRRVELRRARRGLRAADGADAPPAVRVRRGSAGGRRRGARAGRLRDSAAAPGPGVRGAGIAYLVVGAIARRGLWRARSVELWLRLLTPYFLVGYVLLAAAAAWADVEGRLARGRAGDGHGRRGGRDVDRALAAPRLRRRRAAVRAARAGAGAPRRRRA